MTCQHNPQHNPKTETHSIGLSLGANLAEPVVKIRQTMDMFAASSQLHITAISSCYRTPPWGKLNQPDFINAACLADTTLSPYELLDFIKKSETALGRIPGEQWGARVIDIDILFYDDEDFIADGLEIPHKYLFERAFVLIPLLEILPGAYIKGKSLVEALAELPEEEISAIEKLKI